MVKAHLKPKKQKTKNMVKVHLKTSTKKVGKKNNNFYFCFYVFVCVFLISLHYIHVEFSLMIHIIFSLYSHYWFTLNSRWNLINVVTMICIISMLNSRWNLTNDLLNNYVEISLSLYWNHVEFSLSLYWNLTNDSHYILVVIMSKSH